MNPTPALRPIARRALAAQSDERLVRLVREGHEPAFEEMLRRYRGPLVAFAAAIVSADGAEDVVQTSLEKAHRALLTDSREINLRPWLFAIVRNAALNAIRGEPRIDELDEAMAVAAEPSEIAEQRDDLDRLVVAMCALPEAQRQALVKRELEGVGHGEIAAQLGTTATAVRGLIFRARLGLRDALGAVVPLPILRALLTEGPAIGLAGGGAGAALLGGAGTKGGTAIAAAIVALGTGIAIDQGRRDGEERKPVAEASQGDPAGEGGSTSAAAAGGASPAAASDGPTSSSGSGGSSGSSSSGEGGGEDGDGGSETSGPGSAGGQERDGEDADDAEAEPPDGASGPGPGGEPGDDDGGGESGSGHGGPGPSGGEEPADPDDSSGPGGGDDDSSGHGGSGSGSSGSGGSGSSGSGSGSSSGSGGSSGPGGGSTPPPPPEPPDDDSPEDDSSGPGSGDEVTVDDD